MEQHNDNSDKTTFKVEFLGEYHDLVIDWNDDKFIYKAKQLFEQLVSITGVPRQCNPDIVMYGPGRLGDYVHIAYHCIDYNAIEDLRINGRWFVVTKEQILTSITHAEGRFHLGYEIWFEEIQDKRTLISYYLVPESLVPEGGCSHDFCRYKNTKTFFNKAKDIINNDQLNAKIVSLIPPSDHRHNERHKILRQFNMLQYFASMCYYKYWREPEDEKNLYLRTRG